jgi:hypothetical protein
MLTKTPQRKYFSAKLQPKGQHIMQKTDNVLASSMFMYSVITGLSFHEL